MNIGDKLATVLFMLVAAGLAALFGYHAFAIVWRDLANGTMTRSSWLILAVGIFLLIAMAMGVRQCARTLRKGKPDATAR